MANRFGMRLGQRWDMCVIRVLILVHVTGSSEGNRLEQIICTLLLNFVSNQLVFSAGSCNEISVDG